MNQERNYTIDFLKAAAIIAVVIIHVSTAYVDRAKPQSFPFDVYIFINGFTRFAVPLFFLSSGLLLGARYNTVPSISAFYKKRIARIIPSYVFWTLIYYLLFSPHLFSDLLSYGFVDNFLTGNTSYQFYFVPTICALYLLFPILIWNKKILLSRFFVASVTILSFLFLYFIYYQQIKIPLYPPLKNALINLSPFLIGIYLSQHSTQTKQFLKKYLSISLGIFVLAGFTICFESLFLFTNTLNMNFVRNQWRPSVFIYALAAGVVFSEAYERYFEKWNTYVLWLSKFSFGVFFIHVALMYPLLKFIDRYRLYDFFSFAVFLLLTISGSYIIIYLSSKIPKVGKLISAS